MGGQCEILWEAAILAVSVIFQKRLFCDGDDSVGVNAICSRPEVADDVISREDA